MHMSKDESRYISEIPQEVLFSEKLIKMKCVYVYKRTKLNLIEKENKFSYHIDKYLFLFYA